MGSSFGDLHWLKNCDILTVMNFRICFLVFVGFLRSRRTITSGFCLSIWLRIVLVFKDVLFLCNLIIPALGKIPIIV